MTNKTSLNIPLEVFAEGLDTSRAAKEIATSAEARHAQAALSYDALYSGRMRTPESFATNTEFLERFLAVMQDNAFVDISDFDIVERRQRWNWILVAIKKAVWNLLRFYTYRLWSQQNEINGFMLAALEGMQAAAKEREDLLEKRVRQLEKDLANARVTSRSQSAQQNDESIP